MTGKQLKTTFTMWIKQQGHKLTIVQLKPQNAGEVSMIVHSGFWANVLMTDQLNVVLG